MTSHGSRRPEESPTEPADGGQAPAGPHRVEWILSAVSTALVLAMIGFTLYQAVRASDRVPRLSVVVGEIRTAPGGYGVEIIVRNDGGRTAAAVLVEGELAAAGGMIETSEANLDYVPAGSSRGGGLFFARDPRSHELRLRVKGYQNP